MDFLSASTQALLPFDHAEFLLSVAKTTYLEVDDFWGAKVLVLTAYLICESKMTNAKEIVECFKAGGEVDEDKLAEHLPWCYEGYNVVKSVDGMKKFLEQLDLSELKDEVAAAESTITLNVKDGHTKTEMKFNELINLNTVLKLSFSLIVVRYSTVNLIFLLQPFFLHNWASMLCKYCNFTCSVVVRTLALEAAIVRSKSCCVPEPEKRKCRSRRKQVVIYIPSF
jgi:hypothetical protein